MATQLKWTAANGEPASITLQEGCLVTIGRKPENDIVLDDKSVSRRHAGVLFDGDAVWVEDLGSSHGTHINGAQINGRAQLKSGDKLRVGAFTLRLDGGAAPAVQAMQESVQTRSAPPPPPPPAPVESVGESPFAGMFGDVGLLYSDEMMRMKGKIHHAVLQKVNPIGQTLKVEKNEELKKEATEALDQVLREMSHNLPDAIPRDKLRQSLLDEILGLGPLEPLLKRPEISEVMVNGPDRIFVESKGKIYKTGVRFFDEKQLLQVIQRIVEPLGRHVDDSSPMVDARLEDGSRVNAVIPPLALDGASITIRKFSEKKLTTDDLIAFGSMTSDMAEFLKEAVRSKQNILVSGGTGSGKTTLLNILSQFIPAGERIVTVEDSAELKLSHENIVRLEARPANIEGKGRITIRDLVINCLRMRPDRIIVGECRGAEALDMLQAMNTGHDGSLTTAHANNPRDALTRLENMVMMAGYELPSGAIREQIASAINLIVQQTRLPDGSRKIVKIVEITGREENVIQMQDIFVFDQTGYDKNGKIQGEYHATGNIPIFIQNLAECNDLRMNLDVLRPKN